jgi:hypothetical protein
MEFKWFCIMGIAMMLAGAIGVGASAFAEANSVAACANAGMEWRDGDCLVPAGVR